MARESGVWSAIVDRVLRRPVVSAIASTALLLVLAIPVLGLKLAVPGFETLPQDLPVIKTYDRIQAAFPGNQIPADVVVERGDASNVALTIGVHRLRERVERARGRAAGDRGVQLRSRRRGGQRADRRRRGQRRLIRGARRAPGPDHPATVGREPGLEANVTGYTASSKDFNELMESRVPIVFAFVLGLAFVLLLVTFRSIVIPLKAILLNLLSVGAAYGVVVWIFQEGHLESLLGFESTGAVVSWLPLFLFVLLFGLSMDYHVFILSRIREGYDLGAATTAAVSQGIKRTAAVVTAAAVVMIAVFGIFATLSSVIFKQFGVGLAVAVLIDATIIRGVLLPATMTLLGDWNWYLPRWLDWLPRIGIGERTASARTQTP